MLNYIYYTKLDYILFHVNFPVYNIFIKNMPIDKKELHHLTMLLIQPKTIVCRTVQLIACD